MSTQAGANTLLIKKKISLLKSYKMLEKLHFLGRSINLDGEKIENSYRFRFFFVTLKSACIEICIILLNHNLESTRGLIFVPSFVILSDRK